MQRRRVLLGVAALAAAAVLVPAALEAQRGGRGNNPFPGGENPDGSLRPSRPLSRLFTQDPYTQYEILEPGSAAFRITYLPETTRVGATEIVNATRAGSEGGDIAVFDPRSGEPVEFTYEEEDNGGHAIHAPLPFPVPEGGIGRVVILKTYTDPRTYIMNGDEIAWVRSLSGYRLGVVLPPGYALVSSNVAAQLTTLADGRLKLAFANPSGLGNPLTVHARPTPADYPPQAFTDMFFDDMKTLYDLGDPASGAYEVEQTYSDYRKGEMATIDGLEYLAIDEPRVVDLDTALQLPLRREGSALRAELAVPITREHQSAHLRLSGTVADGSYRAEGGGLVFERTLRGLRNTIVLPEGYELQAVSQSGTIGEIDGRPFVALINLNGENEYRVRIRAVRRD